MALIWIFITVFDSPFVLFAEQLVFNLTGKVITIESNYKEVEEIIGYFALT